MLKKPLYHCSQCKKILPELEELLFVEEGSQRGFCSESCIEKYFSPLIEHYELQEKKIRKKLGVNDEPCMKYVGQQSYMESTLARPSQIWRLENELKEEIFCFVGEFKEKETQYQNTFYLLIICSVFDHRPSFIFAVTATKDPRILKEYQIGEPVSDPKSFVKSPNPEELALPSDIHPEALSLLEMKKSQVLAAQLEKRSMADIPFEQFNLYDSFFEATLMDPDEIYRVKDDDGDILLTYIKAHNQGETSFYYYVLMLKLDSRYYQGSDKAGDKEVLLPVLSFPSVDAQMAELYRQGDLLTGVTKN